MLFQKLLSEINKVDEKSIIEERKIILQPLINYINLKLNNSEEIRLNFICTHNSRRSHLAQVWAQTMAEYFNYKQVFCYSGGTGLIRLSIAIVNSCSNLGLELIIQQKKVTISLFNKIQFKSIANNWIFKTFDSPFNPKTDFAAILTCSEADVACPFVKGADIRIPMTFEDPKVYDNTNLQKKSI